MERLEYLMNYIIKELVQEKEEVRVSYEVIDSTVTFQIRVAKGNGKNYWKKWTYRQCYPRCDAGSGSQRQIECQRRIFGLRRGR